MEELQKGKAQQAPAIQLDQRLPLVAERPLPPPLPSQDNDPNRLSTTTPTAQQLPTKPTHWTTPPGG